MCIRDRHIIPIMNIDVITIEEEEEVLRGIDEKIGSIDCVDEGILHLLKEI